jgi:hypothetical protein
MCHGAILLTILVPYDMHLSAVSTMLPLLADVAKAIIRDHKKLTDVEM